MPDNQITILLVEDNEEHIELILRSFQEADTGWKIETASTIGEACNCSHVQLPSLVLADMRLPDGSGLDLIEKCRHHEIPVIIMTSFGDERLAVEALKRGALDYVAKSTESFANMYHIITRALREWSHIAERRKAENSLRESEERFRQIAENIQEVFFLYEREGHKSLYISPVITSLLGLTSEMVDRKVIDKLIHPDDLQKVHFIDPKYFYSQQIDEEFRIKRPDGEIRWIRFRSFLVHDSNGNVIRVAGLAADITGQKNAAEKERLHTEQLQQADKLASLGILVSGVAHEINNPNNFIMLNTPLIRDVWEQAKPILEDHFEKQGDFELGGIPYSEMKATIPELINGIEEGSKRIKKIVEDLKGFARKDTSSYDNTIEVGLVIKESVSLLSSMIRKRTDHFILKIPDTPVYIKGNKQKLEQVIINLIHNACDAIESRQKLISVLLQVDQSDCLIKVIDEGRGISKDDLEHITKPFFTRKRESGGTGLGLSISSGIVKEHQGKLLFESELGKGTTAIISLPLAINQIQNKKRTVNDV